MSRAQNFEWVQQLSGGNNDQSFGIDVDASGHIYIADVFLEIILMLTPARTRSYFQILEGWIVSLVNTTAMEI